MRQSPVVSSVSADKVCIFGATPPLRCDGGDDKFRGYWVKIGGLIRYAPTLTLTLEVKDECNTRNACTIWAYMSCMAIHLIPISPSCS
jgi:hypothetical protein